MDPDLSEEGGGGGGYLDSEGIYRLQNNNQSHEGLFISQVLYRYRSI